MVKKEKLPSSTRRFVMKGARRWLVFGGAHHMQMSWNSASNHRRQERKLSWPAGLCSTCYIHRTMSLRVVSMLWILSTRHPRCCHQNGRHHVQSVSCLHWSRSLEEIHMHQGEVCAMYSFDSFAMPTWSIRTMTVSGCQTSHFCQTSDKDAQLGSCLTYWLKMTEDPALCLWRMPCKQGLHTRRQAERMELLFHHNEDDGWSCFGIENIEVCVGFYA